MEKETYRNQYQKGHWHCLNHRCGKKLEFHLGAGNQTYKKYCSSKCKRAAMEQRAREATPRASIPVPEAMEKVEKVLQKFGIFELIGEPWRLQRELKDALSRRPQPATDRWNGIERDADGSISERLVYDPKQEGFVPCTQEEVLEWLDSGEVHDDDGQGLRFQW